MVLISTDTADGGIDDTQVLLSTADKVLMTHLYCYLLLMEVLLTH